MTDIEHWFSENSDVFRKLADAFKQLAEVSRQSIELLAEKISPIAGQVAAVIRELLDVADIYAGVKTDPPRIPVRCIGCKPYTKSRRSTRCYIRTGYRHK